MRSTTRSRCSRQFRSAEKPLTLPYTLATSAVPPNGKKLFVQGMKPSAGARDTGLTPGLKGVADQGDRVAVTAVYVEAVSNVEQAKLKTVAVVPEKPARTSKSKYGRAHHHRQRLRRRDPSVPRFRRRQDMELVDHVGARNPHRRGQGGAQGQGQEPERRAERRRNRADADAGRRQDEEEAPAHGGARRDRPGHERRQRQAHRSHQLHQEPVGLRDPQRSRRFQRQERSEAR